MPGSASTSTAVMSIGVRLILIDHSLRVASVSALGPTGSGSPHAVTVIGVAGAALLTMVSGGPGLTASGSVIGD